MMSGDLEQSVPYAMGLFVSSLFIFSMHYLFSKDHIAPEAFTAGSCILMLYKRIPDLQLSTKYVDSSGLLCYSATD